MTEVEGMEPTRPLVRDIKERDPPAQASTHWQEPIQTSGFPTGFPRLQRRWKKSPSLASASQQSHALFERGSQDAAAHGALNCEDSSENFPAAAPADPNFWAAEKRRIDLENQQRLAEMLPGEIEKAQANILSGLDPSILRRLLTRARIEDGGDHIPFKGGHGSPNAGPLQAGAPKRCDAKHTEATAYHMADTSPPPSPTSAPSVAVNPDVGFASQPMPNEDAAPVAHISPDELFRPSEPLRSTHFPAVLARPELDAAHADFLTSLHAKYFPNLPADPSKLAWMAPLPSENSLADRESSYYPGRSTISASSLRFDFSGMLVPPRLARVIPISRGLHHHGDAPEAAGYTVRELALLARSAVPAQRCVAFQTLGRILFRLGKGELGGGPDDEIAAAVWAEVIEGRVLDTLYDAATPDYGHRSSKAFATEALWLFEKGGWKNNLTGS